MEKKDTRKEQEPLSNYDSTGSASHYDQDRINTIRMIEAVWGTLATRNFCEITAFKYRMRIGRKDDPVLELVKMKWYETMAGYLSDKLGTDEELSGFGCGAYDKVGLPREFLGRLEK